MEVSRRVFSLLPLLCLSGTRLRLLAQDQIEVQRVDDTLVVNGDLDVIPLLQSLNQYSWVSADGNQSKTAVISGINWTDPSTYDGLLQAVSQSFRGKLIFVPAYQDTNAAEGVLHAAASALGVPTAKNALSLAQGDFGNVVTYSGGEQVAHANIANGSLVIDHQGGGKSSLRCCRLGTSSR